MNFLQRPAGRLAYEVEGDGPLVVCAPGMGDLRSSYRLFAPELVAAGFRVASIDLRGHGDSDATFSAYDDEALADDLAALITELGGPAVVVGNSMAAGAGVILAARHPDRVSGLVLLGPFVRNPPTSAVARMLFRGLTKRWWGPLVWKAYLPSLYAGRKPADFAAYRDSVVAALRRPGHARAFELTTQTTHEPAERLLAQVAAPSMVIMGEQDPDFTAPRAEADWISVRLGSEIVMVPECGHYPQSQRPDLTVPAALSFVRRVSADADA